MHVVCSLAWSKIEGTWHEKKVGAQPGRDKGARIGHLKVAAPADAGAGAGGHEQQQQQESHTSWGGRAMDPANARSRGEQQFPKVKGAGLRLSLECWRQAQDMLFPLLLPSVVPPTPSKAHAGRDLPPGCPLSQGTPTLPTGQAEHTGAG